MNPTCSKCESKAEVECRDCLTKYCHDHAEEAWGWDSCKRFKVISDFVKNCGCDSHPYYTQQMKRIVFRHNTDMVYDASTISHEEAKKQFIETTLSRGYILIEPIIDDLEDNEFIIRSAIGYVGKNRARKIFAKNGLFKFKTEGYQTSL